MTTPDLTLNFAELYGYLNKLAFPFLRFSAFFWFMPLYASGTLIFVARIALSLLLAVLAANLIQLPEIAFFSILGVLTALEQIVFSMIFALFAHFFFQVFKLAGSMLSSQMGLSMASMADPTTGEAEPLLAQFFYYAAIFLYFSMGMHWVMLHLLVQSFSLWPIGTSLYELDIIGVISLLGWVISSAFTLVFPVVSCLLMINLAFGLLGKTTPSLNVFSMGFSIIILMGFFLISLWLIQSFGAFNWVMSEVIASLESFIRW